MIIHTDPENPELFEVGPRRTLLVDLSEDSESAVATDRLYDDVEPNALSSELRSPDDWGRSGMHAPALDIDIPMSVVASSTPGHCHLYFPTLRLDWTQYSTLLEVLADCGILQEGYVKASLERKGTHLRLPGVRKEEQS